MLQTIAAIINSALDENDFLGLLTDRDFLILTSPIKAEKIASFMTFAFESVKNKFYSEHDLERGYMMLNGDELSEHRCNFVNATTGGVTSDIKKFNSPEDVIQELNQAYNLAKKKDTSSYLIERPKIAGAGSVVQKEFNNKIVIKEQDEALSLLLATALGLKGYSTVNFDKIESIESYNPALVILDTGDDKEMKELEFCQKIKKNNPKIKIITTSIYHSKESILNAGSDIYLPKPYNMNTLAKWVELAIKEFNE